MTLKDVVYKRYFIIHHKRYRLENIFVVQYFITNGPFIVGTGMFPSVFNGSGNCEITSWEQNMLNI